jgi:hypothetical protein
MGGKTWFLRKNDVFHGIIRIKASRRNSRHDRKGGSVRFVKAGVVVVFLFAKTGMCLNFAAYGDTRDNPAEHSQLLSQIAKDSPQVVLHVGDLWGGTGAAAWKAAVTGQPAMAALLSANRFLVSRGNHETEAEVLAFSPSLVRRDSILYSFTEGNCFFACMGYDPGLNSTWLEAQLSSAACQNAAWRFVWAHKPVYSTGSHGADGNTSEGTSVVNFRSLCDKYKVNIVFSGHDHEYERSKLIRSGLVTDSTDNFPATASGTVYLLTGGGGAPLYGVVAVPPWWRKFGQSIYEYCVIQAGNDSLVMTAKKSDGTLLDAFIWHKAVTSAKTGKAVFEGNNAGLRIHHGMLSFRLTVPKKAFLRLYDVSGKVLADFSQECKTMRTGKNFIVIGKAVPKGVYVVEFGNGNQVSAGIVSTAE